MRTVIVSLFVLGTFTLPALGHCGSCGVGNESASPAADQACPHAAQKAEMACPVEKTAMKSECCPLSDPAKEAKAEGKACKADKKTACATKKPCCAKEKTKTAAKENMAKPCAKDCTKPCCRKADASESTGVSEETNASELEGRETGPEQVAMSDG